MEAVILAVLGLALVGVEKSHPFLWQSPVMILKNIS